MSTTTPQPPESAPAATPVPSSTPVVAAPAAQKAAPVKRARLPARKVASEVTPAKETAVKKVTAKAAAPQKAVVKTTLAKAAVVVKPVKKAVPPKAKKDKLIRDSFTIPKAEYAVIDELKQRTARQLDRPAKKSELLRAGIKLLATLSNAALATALAQVPTIKTGRPALKK
ncbi:MAG: hypothetical protein ABJA84_10615 [Polaromonas sp.]